MEIYAFRMEGPAWDRVITYCGEWLNAECCARRSPSRPLLPQPVERLALQGHLIVQPQAPLVPPSATRLLSSHDQHSPGILSPVHAWRLIGKQSCEE